MSMPKNEAEAQRAIEQLNAYLSDKFGRHFVAAVAFGIEPAGPTGLPAQTKVAVLNLQECPMSTGLNGLKGIHQQITTLLGGPLIPKPEDVKRHDPSMG